MCALRVHSLFSIPFVASVGNHLARCQCAGGSSKLHCESNSSGTICRWI